jgi:hypothetical protein
VSGSRRVGVKQEDQPGTDEAAGELGEREGRHRRGHRARLMSVGHRVRAHDWQRLPSHRPRRPRTRPHRSAYRAEAVVALVGEVQALGGLGGGGAGLAGRADGAAAGAGSLPVAPVRMVVMACPLVSTRLDVGVARRSYPCVARRRQNSTRRTRSLSTDGLGFARASVGRRPAHGRRPWFDGLSACRTTTWSAARSTSTARGAGPGSSALRGPRGRPPGSEATSFRRSTTCPKIRQGPELAAYRVLANSCWVPSGTALPSPDTGHPLGLGVRRET